MSLISRANVRYRVVRGDVNWQRRLDWLTRPAEEHGWRVHVFVQRNNHEHPFVETPKANRSRRMKPQKGVETPQFNARPRRRGHSFRGGTRATC